MSNHGPSQPRKRTEGSLQYNETSKKLALSDGRGAELLESYNESGLGVDDIGGDYLPPQSDHETDSETEDSGLAEQVFQEIQLEDELQMIVGSLTMKCHCLGLGT